MRGRPGRGPRNVEDLGGRPEEEVRRRLHRGGWATRRERAGAREKDPVAPAQDIRVDARKAARKHPARDGACPGQVQAPGGRRPRRRPRPRRVRGPCGGDTSGCGARREAPSPDGRPVHAARRHLGRRRGGDHAPPAGRACLGRGDCGGASAPPPRSTPRTLAGRALGWPCSRGGWPRSRDSRSAWHTRCATRRGAGTA